MDTSLLTEQRVGHASFIEEVKRICCIAGPVIPVISSQFLLQIVSTMIVGHVDALSLASAALAISICGVTGFSFLLGMACGLETLCGQAYGAEQYHKFGMQIHTAILTLVLMCVPLALIWFNMERILILIGQDALISHEAGRFTIWLVPGLFAYAIQQPLVRYLLMQSLNLPMLITSSLTFCIHIPLCWALVYNTGFGNIGAAIALSISISLNTAFIGLYIRFSSACSKTRVPISMKLFKGIAEFLRFAFPSAIMFCLEWWSFELLILLSGLLPDPELETSVLSVCLNTILTLYSIPFGIGAAASTRVSNELGGGNPRAARVAVMATMFLAVMETSAVSATLLACRALYGHVFSSDKDVIEYVTALTPLVSLSVVLDALQGALSGVARGCGWQHLGAYINLGAFYLCGIPLAATLAFWVKLRGRGLWVGIQIGAFVQTLLLSIITSCIDWEQEVINARKRLFGRHLSEDNGLVREVNDENSI